MSRQKLLHITAGVYIGPPRGELVGGSLESARRHGLAHELLDHAALRRRFPQFHVPEDWQALYEEKAGFLLPERVVAAYAEAALRRGAELHGHEPVIAWNADSNGVAVGTPGREYRAEHVIFCGGPWSGRLLNHLGVQLRVTRQVMGWVWPRRPELFELGRFPVWAIENPDGSLQYGFPLFEGSPGLKTAHHGPEAAVPDPDRVVRDELPGDVETFKPALARFLPDGDGPVLAMRICLYTNSPDHHFIIDRHPNHDRVTFACGFSGHGFKFASVVGEVLADLAIAGNTSLPVEFLRIRRLLGNDRAAAREGR